MSLIKKSPITEKKLAALRENRKHSHGPKTAADRERIRNANLRHGYYSKADTVALRALGEDPADFRKLREGLRGKETATTTLQERLADRLARAFLRMDRADRMQEGYALRQAQEEDCTREGRLHVKMMDLKMISRNWQWLAQSVAHEHYVTTPADLELMKNLDKQGVAKEMSAVALALFYQLREPGTLGPGDPGFEDEDRQAQQRAVLYRIKEIFGLADDQEPSADAGVCQGVPVQGDHQDDGVTEADQAEPHSDSSQISSPEARVPNPAPNPYPDITEEQWA